MGLFLSMSGPRAICSEAVRVRIEDAFQRPALLAMARSGNMSSQLVEAVENVRHALLVGMADMAAGIAAEFAGRFL